LILYLLPPLLHRGLPLREGGSRLDAPGFHPWWASHQLQVVFIALPALEALLRLAPGIYSAWLRLWGARVGRRVHWTPMVEISDRSLLEVGDGVVFGHRAGLYGHAIRPGRRGLILWVGRIRIGPMAFVGAGARLGPGVRVPPGAVVPALSLVLRGKGRGR
jgi:acetyltransferase-like isoleucine patch superfamily enzyme